MTATGRCAAGSWFCSNCGRNRIRLMPTSNCNSMNDTTARRVIYVCSDRQFSSSGCSRSACRWSFTAPARFARLATLPAIILQMSLTLGLTIGGR
ncbi:hypothetical protein J6590_026876 [Homalodisca vitripennis]|nr:hypothetical protein J6590_026876 [Homalodisca vitripennis]